MEGFTSFLVTGCNSIKGTLLTANQLRASESLAVDIAGWDPATFNHGCGSFVIDRYLP